MCVQEVVTHFIKELYKKGNYFFDRRYILLKKKRWKLKVFFFRKILINSFLIFLPGTSARHIIHNIIQHFMKTWYHFLWLQHILINLKNRTYKQSYIVFFVMNFQVTIKFFLVNFEISQLRCRY